MKARHLQLETAIGENRIDVGTVDGVDLPPAEIDFKIRVEFACWNRSSMNTGTLMANTDDLPPLLCASHFCNCCFRHRRTNRRRDDGGEADEANDDGEDGDEENDGNDDEDEAEQRAILADARRSPLEHHGDVKEEQQEEEALEREIPSEDVPPDSSSADARKAFKILTARRAAHPGEDAAAHIKLEYDPVTASSFVEEAVVDAVLHRSYMDLWDEIEGEDDAHIKDEDIDMPGDDGLPGPLDRDLSAVVGALAVLAAWSKGLVLSFKDFEYVATLPSSPAAGKTALVKLAQKTFDSNDEEMLAWSVEWIEVDHVDMRLGELKGRLTDTRGGRLTYFPKGKDSINVRNFTQQYTGLEIDSDRDSSWIDAGTSRR